MKKFLLILPLAVAGCVGTPAVSDFNGSSVKIQEAFGGQSPSAATVAEAKRICAKVGKNSEPASTRNMPD